MSIESHKMKFKGDGFRIRLCSNEFYSCYRIFHAICEQSPKSLELGSHFWLHIYPAPHATNTLQKEMSSKSVKISKDMNVADAVQTMIMINGGWYALIKFKEEYYNAVINDRNGEYFNDALKYCSTYLSTSNKKLFNVKWAVTRLKLLFLYLCNSPMMNFVCKYIYLYINNM